MAAPGRVLELIERFDRNRIAYRSEQYNEARLRIEFLNPFFEDQGWDVNNRQGYAEATKGKRGTAEVDAAFLQEIESWRELLAHHLALRNKNLTQRELNYAVQMTIDRIIFLRICEDRGIEEYERLKGLLKGTNIYTRLCTLFQEADDRYNSGLFHFQKEKNWDEAPDTLTPHLIIEDKPLKD